MARRPRAALARAPARSRTMPPWRERGHEREQPRDEPPDVRALDVHTTSSPPLLPPPLAPAPHPVQRATTRVNTAFTACASAVGTQTKRSEHKQNAHTTTTPSLHRRNRRRLHPHHIQSSERRRASTPHGYVGALITAGSMFSSHKNTYAFGVRILRRCADAQLQQLATIVLRRFFCPWVLGNGRVTSTSP